MACKIDEVLKVINDLVGSTRSTPAKDAINIVKSRMIQMANSKNIVKENTSFDNLLSALQSDNEKSTKNKENISIVQPSETSEDTKKNTKESKYIVRLEGMTAKNIQDIVDCAK